MDSTYTHQDCQYPGSLELLNGEPFNQRLHSFDTRKLSTYNAGHNPCLWSVF